MAYWPKAQGKYLRENIVKMQIGINRRTDADVLEYLDTLTVSKRSYILGLIRADMRRREEEKAPTRE